MTSVQTITATAKDWIAALNRLSPAMAGKKPLPILSAVHIDPAPGVVSGFNYETSAVASLQDHVGEGAPFLVSYRWLLDAIRSFTGRTKSASVTVTQDGNKITIAACGYEVHAEAMPVTDYPEVPWPNPAVVTELPAAELRAAFRRAAVAASQDDALPILAAVQVNLRDGALELLATDRYRLAADYVQGKGVGESSFVIKRAMIKSIDRFLVGDTVLIGAEDNRVFIQAEDVMFTTVSVDGDYPKIKSLFPESVTTSFEFDRQVLLESAKVAERLNERHAPCIVRLSDAGAEVTFNYGIFGPSKAPTAEGGVVAGQKEDVLFALNPKYLVETLQQIPTDGVRVSYTTAPKPFLFSPAGVDFADATSPKHLIMPVRLPQ